MVKAVPDFRTQFIPENKHYSRDLYVICDGFRSHCLKSI